MQDDQSYQDKKRGNKVLFGLLLIGAGAWVLMRNLHITPNLDFELIWPYALIVVGVLIGLKNRFSSNAPYILIAIGIFHAVPEFVMPIGNRNIPSSALALPIIIIAVGVLFIFKPRRKACCQHRRNFSTSADGSIEIDVVFGGRKEIITSKNFSGGSVTATFGGAELNLMQAESPNQNVILDIRTTFGGCELIIPSQWEVRNEIVPIFGSVEDERMIRTKENEESKTTLILKGSCVFGGVEIKSF